MRILIADDHALFRRGLKEVILEHFQNTEFAEANNADEALNKVWNSAWDLLILDISMPGRSGVDILREILQAQPKLPVLVLSAYSEEQYAKRVLDAGAEAFLTKISAPSELVKIMDKILAGEIGPQRFGFSNKQKAFSTAGISEPRLSNREYEILLLLASGFTTKGIASRVDVAEQTISTYRARMLRKLHLHSTAELVRYAVEKKLVI